MFEIILAFLTEYSIEVALSSVFVVGYSAYTIRKAKGTINKFKVQYCDVTSVIKQYKKLDKKMSDGISGGNKNAEFFK